MPVSHETEQKMKQIEERPTPAPENLVEPKEGWQCPVCGLFYDAEGICPVDQALLVQIENWSETAATSDETSTKEVMETGDELYPSADR